MKYLILLLLFISSQVFAQAKSVAPRENPQIMELINVSNTTELKEALSNAQPGDVIFLGNGIYDGTLTLSKSGTLQNPIIIRGESQAGVRIVDGMVEKSACSGKSGSNVFLNGSHIYLENLTIEGGDWGVKLRARASQEGVVIRNIHIKDVYCGISLWNDRHSKHYICDNRIEGRLTQESRIQNDVTNKTGRTSWSIDGIKFAGNDLTICHNTLSGFGDTIDNSPSYPTNNLDVYGNDILFGGDDGLEIDGDTHNARIFKNRISNSGTGISVQPDTSSPGPYYIYRNVIYNVGLTYDEGGQILTVKLPFKFKNGADNIYLYHNTSVRAGFPWQSSGKSGIIENLNNLILGTTTTYSLPIFYPADPILSSGSQDWTQLRTPGELALAPGSFAIDSGSPCNPKYCGSPSGIPDLGAYEFGQALPVYGVRTSSSESNSKPKSPTNLRVEQ